MASGLGSSVAIVAYLALFAGIGFAFVFVNLLIGRFLRPANPHAEKQEIYECGEPAIGSSFVQFDLRFYVVALVFIIFDVEVAFLFPWATVFGKSTNLMHQAALVVDGSEAPLVQMGDDGTIRLAPMVSGIYQELGVRNPSVTVSDRAEEVIVAGSRRLSQLALLAGGFFFAVLFVGFAYEWRTGALDWVRAIRREHAASRTSGQSAISSPQESVLSA